MLELIGQQYIGETAGETHEMVGRDGRGYSYGHVSGPLRNQREQESERGFAPGSPYQFAGATTTCRNRPSDK
ncbi:hypothetical protein GCM10011588_19230 [Nocardia jinanensis]|uniref:Uncharacterized protein n=1 Tax=Nocardia jinanensis TaxID=382504 RepID=A0A917RFA3_9NOCA|nr:hypothetical protein GCM10011588_19230 [Nocardia jinanensis]